MAGSSKKTKLAIWGLIVLFAAMMSTAFLVPGLGFMAILGFTPLFCAEKLCRLNGIRHTWWYGYVAMLLFNIGATYWIWYVSPAGAVAAIILNALQMAVIFALFRCSARLMEDRGWKCASWLPYVVFIVLWLAWEHVYFDIEISWPWLVLGNAFATSLRLVQWYSLTGALGGSLWILVASVLCFLMIDSLCNGRKAAVPASALAIVVLLPAIISIASYYSYEETDNPIEVVAVQPNVDPFAKYGVTPQEGIDESLLSLAGSVATPNTHYIITPETFTFDINLDNPAGNDSYQRYQALFDRYPQANVLLGALTYSFYRTSARPTNSARQMGDRWYDVFNSAIVFDREGLFNYYHKSKLVPGVEIIPYQHYVPFLGKLVAKFGGSSTSYGVMHEMKALKGNDGNMVAPMICYESIYGDYSRNAVKEGANFLAVITNDGWWGDSPGYRQHFRFASLRAIENRRDVVHVANTGISGFINQRGDVLQRTGWWVPTAIVGNVNTNDSLTPFSVHGDVIGRICAWAAAPLLLAMVILAVAARRKRSK